MLLSFKNTLISGLPKPEHLFLMTKGLKFQKEVAGEGACLGHRALSRRKIHPGLWKTLTLWPFGGCCCFPAFRRGSSCPQECFSSISDSTANSLLFQTFQHTLQRQRSQEPFPGLSPWFSDSSHLNPQTLQRFCFMIHFSAA